MAASQEEILVIKLLKKMERKGTNIKEFLYVLMDHFEDDVDEKKNDEIRMRAKGKVSLLYDQTASCVCRVGHTISSNEYKHLNGDPCIQCGEHGIIIKKKPNQRQILKFLSQYNIYQIPFGPDQQHKQGIELWKSRGWDKKWPLHVAAQSADIVKIRLLCKHKHFNANQKLTNWDNALPLTIAARWGQLEAVIELIKHGANPLPPPDKSNSTPYSTAIHNNHKSIIVFYQQFFKFVYNARINKQINLQCHYCYNFDLCYNKYSISGTMANYVYCKNCALGNVKKIKKQLEINQIMLRRTYQTLKENPSISVDALCQMKDVKSLHSTLREITTSGQKTAYSLWLFDIDNFRTINSYLTHARADTKLQAIGNILKKLERRTMNEWRGIGLDGLWKIHVFRQGGDEFSLVVYSNIKKINVLQKLYEILRHEIQKIKLENIPKMPHITASIGVCTCQGIDSYEETMKHADSAAEIVKQNGRNGISIHSAHHKKNYTNFNDWGK